MDAKNGLMKNKRQKCDDGNKKEKNSGIINLDALPQDILGEIISILPLKDAIRTSVLSKSWKHRWKCTSKIEVKEQDYKNRQQFTDFVDELLTLCTSCITKFSLKCRVGEDTHQVNQWLSGFIKNTIHELKLHVYSVTEPLVFPDYMFTSKTITHFHLRMRHVLNLPSSIHFPSLRTLTLKHVVFPDTTRTQQFFAGCPCLQELTLINCNWVNVQSVCIVCPLLQSLIISEWSHDNSYNEEENYAFYQNVNPMTYCKIVIHGSSNLKKFSYYGGLLNHYSLFNTPCVVESIVQVHQPPENNTLHRGHFVFNLLMAISNVKRLFISDFVIEALRYFPYLIRELPLFNNLIELHVGSEERVNLACLVMQTILRHAPNLEILEFPMGVALRKNSVNKIYPIPACFETHIKAIRIYGFGGTVEEMVAIKLLIQWATTAYEFHVSVGTNSAEREEGRETLEQLMKEILKYHRDEICELYVVA